MFELIPFDRRMHRTLPYDPFREMDDFLFGNTERRAVSSFRTDVIDDGSAFILNAELPGFRKEDIRLSVDKDCLTISAERKLEDKDSRPNFIKCERFYGLFSRSFDLSGIETDGIEASYTDGLLSLRLPKKVEDVPASRSIEIR